MKTFKVICSKNSQKVNLVVSNPTAEAARVELNRQGYAIIEIQEIQQSEDDEQGVFYFEAYIGNATKKGQIKSVDIFKAYVKLVDDLEYNVTYIYDTPDAELSEKKLITARVKENYKIYAGNHDAEEKFHQKKKQEEQFYMWKKIEKYQGFIVKIIEKIEVLLNAHDAEISPDKRNRLKELYGILKKLATSTNLSKLKDIGEKTLMRIGEIEVDIIEKRKIQERKKFLKDTNDLLKGIGSSQKVMSDEDNWKLKASKYLQGWWKKMEQRSVKKQQEKQEGQKVDRISFVYYQTLRELDIYRRKLKDARKEYYKAKFITFNQEKQQEYRIRVQLIKQNIFILKGRIQNRSIQYVKLTRTIQSNSSQFYGLLNFLGDVIAMALVLYCMYFIVWQTLSLFHGKSLPLKLDFFNVFTLGIFLSLVLKLAKKLSMLIVMGVVFAFIYQFFSINF